MRTDHTTPGIVAVQPENEVEQQLVGALFTRLNNVVDAPAHPEKNGSRLCYYTLDLDGYPDLDHDLWSEADIGVTEGGLIDPDAGSRALVIVHDPDAAAEAEREAAIEEATVSDFTPGQVEVAEELLADDDLAIGDLDYREMQEYAKRADIPANQSADTLRDALFNLTNTYVALSPEHNGEEDGEATDEANGEPEPELLAVEDEAALEGGEEGEEA